MRGCIRNDEVRRAPQTSNGGARRTWVSSRPWVASIGLLLLAGCAGASKATVQKPVELSEIWVKHHLVPCKGWEGQDYCFAVAEQPDGPWTLAYDGLQNFYYQWGYSYRLLVGPSQFGGTKSSGKRVFKITRKRRVQVGTEFDFPVDPQLGQLGLRTHVTMNNGIGKILMGPAFTCASRPLCDEIERRLDTDDRFVVRFAYGVGGGIQAVGVNQPATEVAVVPVSVEATASTSTMAAANATSLEVAPTSTSTTVALKTASTSTTVALKMASTSTLGRAVLASTSTTVPFTRTSTTEEGPAINANTMPASTSSTTGP
ncbi:MAG: DUF4377 domain-containing protein [Myxococcota bacterium]